MNVVWSNNNKKIFFNYIETNVFASYLKQLFFRYLFLDFETALEITVSLYYIN